MQDKNKRLARLVISAIRDVVKIRLGLKTDAAVAEAIGISRQELSYYLTGKRDPGLSKIIDLAAKVGVPHISIPMPGNLTDVRISLSEEIELGPSTAELLPNEDAT